MSEANSRTPDERDCLCADPENCTQRVPGYRCKRDFMPKERHFNKLTPAETELLALLAEECGELVQAIGKILRHGLTSCHPDTGIRNRASLEREMGDVRAAMILLCEAGIVAKSRVHERADNKLWRVEQFLHHASVPPALKESK